MAAPRAKNPVFGLYVAENFNHLRLVAVIQVNRRADFSGIEDLGKTAVVSELESIDELFYRAARAKPTEDIATAQAGTRARTLVRQMAKKNGIPSLGTLMYSNRKPAGSVTEFCFEADYSLLFTIKTVAGKPYLNSMKQLDYCPASGSPN